MKLLRAVRRLRSLIECDPPLACVRHGRCWTHSKWQSEKKKEKEGPIPPGEGDCWGAPWKYDFSYRRGQESASLDDIEVDVPRLIEDIRQSERERKAGAWKGSSVSHDVACYVGELVQPFNSPQERTYGFNYPYESYMSALYALRAYCRGKIHIRNAPMTIRDHNNTMRETGNSHRVIAWDAKGYNRKIAERLAGKYERQKEKEEPCQKKH